MLETRRGMDDRVQVGKRGSVPHFQVLVTLKRTRKSSSKDAGEKGISKTGIPVSRWEGSTLLTHRHSRASFSYEDTGQEPQWAPETIGSPEPYEYCFSCI